MVNILTCALELNKVFRSFDKCRFRATERPKPRQELLLKKNCLFYQGKLYDPICTGENRYFYPDGFDIQIVGPNPLALEVLEQLKARTTYIEVSINMIFTSPVLVAYLEQYFHSHYVQAYHGQNQTIKVKNGAYTGQRDKRKSGKIFSWYGDRPDKVTGNSNCFHFEGRAYGNRACERIGLGNSSDLITWDKDKFQGFVDEFLFQLYDVDIELLGRCYSNKFSERKRRKATANAALGSSFNDRRLGGLLLHAWVDRELDVNTQYVLDTTARKKVTKNPRKLLKTKRYHGLLNVVSNKLQAYDAGDYRYGSEMRGAVNGERLSRGDDANGETATINIIRGDGGISTEDRVY